MPRQRINLQTRHARCPGPSGHVQGVHVLISGANLLNIYHLMADAKPPPTNFKVNKRNEGQ
jgi:hypothetical protein